MQIYCVDELPEGNLGTSINKDWQRDYARKLLVITDATTTPAYVRNNTVPPGGTSPVAIGQYWALGAETDTGALVTGIQVTYRDKVGSRPDTGAAIDGIAWEMDITCGFWNPAEQTLTGDPTAQPPRASIEFVVREVPCTKDINGSPILNTAGDPFDPPLMRERLGAIIRLKENVTTRKIATEAGYADQVNLTAWLSFPARTVKVLPTRFSDPLYSQATGAAYFERERMWEYNPDTWDKHVLNCGYKQVIAATSGGSTTYQKVTILGDDNQPISSPDPLDMNGARIPPPFDLDSTADPAGDDDIGPGNTDTTPPAPGTPSPVVYLTFQVYNTLEFNTVYPYPSSILE